MKFISKNKAGLIQTIILLVIAIFLMSYFHVTIKDFFGWLWDAIKNVFQWK